MTQQVHEVLKGRIWRGQPVFIVGGGPSLNSFDFEQLRGQKVVVVNRAFEDVPWADVFITMDGRFLKRFQEDLENFHGHKIYVDNGRPWDIPAGFLTCRSLGERIVSERLHWGLGHGTNSGYCALNLALLLGAEPAVLLGFDLNPTTENQQQWYHTGYPWKGDGDAYRRYRDNFEWLAKKPLCRRRVLNASLTSSIQGFPFVADITEVKKHVDNPKDDIVVVAYYTNDFYRIEGARLIASCAQLDIPLRFEAWPNQSNWTLNTQEKAKFIRHMLERVQGRDVLYLDADAIVRQDPREYLSHLPQEVDIAAGWRKDKELLSGTLFIRNSTGAKCLLDRWIRQNDVGPNWDQRTLQAVWHDSPQCYRLPPEYTFIFDISRREYPGLEPVIEHFQASRRFKKQLQR